MLNHSQSVLGAPFPVAPPKSACAPKLLLAGWACAPSALPRRGGAVVSRFAFLGTRAARLCRAGVLRFSPCSAGVRTGCCFSPCLAGHTSCPAMPSVLKGNWRGVCAGACTFFSIPGFFAKKAEPHPFFQTDAVRFYFSKNAGAGAPSMIGLRRKSRLCLTAGQRLRRQAHLFPLGRGEGDAFCAVLLLLHDEHPGVLQQNTAVPAILCHGVHLPRL